ncbi:MAG TPA: hypothetical protein VIY28_19710 [Pseudonocardiaceae bacterium]
MLQVLVPAHVVRGLVLFLQVLGLGLGGRLMLEGLRLRLRPEVLLGEHVPADIGATATETGVLHVAVIDVLIPATSTGTLLGKHIPTQVRATATRPSALHITVIDVLVTPTSTGTLLGEHIPTHIGAAARSLLQSENCRAGRSAGLDVAVVDVLIPATSTRTLLGEHIPTHIRATGSGALLLAVIDVLSSHLTHFSLVTDVIGLARFSAVVIDGGPDALHLVTPGHLHRIGRNALARDTRGIGVPLVEREDGFPDFGVEVAG